MGYWICNFRFLGGSARRRWNLVGAASTAFKAMCPRIAMRRTMMTVFWTRQMDGA